MYIGHPVQHIKSCPHSCYLFPSSFPAPQHVCSNNITPVLFSSPPVPLFAPQASSRGYDRLAQFGAASKHGLARGDQERLLMKLRVIGLLQDDTARQEQHGSIVSVLSVHQVGGCIVVTRGEGQGLSGAG